MKINKFINILFITALALLFFTIPGFPFTDINLNSDEEVSKVRLWEERIVLPTYIVGAPDPNPMFYLGRAYQGAEGKVYPYPLYDKLTGKKADKTYNIVYLENEFIKIGISPEMGGRIFSAFDKTNGYDFIYKQHVIKPALIGMLGAWISGGLELNIPHHHRPTSFLPVQYCKEEHEDGSKTVWVGEMELRYRSRWAVGYTLRPGKSYIEMTTRIMNRTPLPQTVLCFTNTAVHVNENYQIIFPPSTQFVTHHAKVEFTTWPVATTRYGNGDFTGGVDVSWYKNHYAANSMFAWNCKDDFLGGYDHGKKAGTVCVSNHHIVPGKKFWTWGNAPSGRMWDNILTDEDGPYIELMVGGYSDNQPDYSWMQPYETKDIKQYWFPVRDIGGIKNANINATVNFEMKENGFSILGFYTTSRHQDALVQLMVGEKLLFEEQISIDPGNPYIRKIKLPKGVKKDEVIASLTAGGLEIISYSPEILNPEPLPDPVLPPLEPKEIKTNEELYLIGRRIQQFHNPALEPEPYWEEALLRDPGDTRVNTALGITYLKKGMFNKAEQHFRKANTRLTANYTTPKEGETFYYLGLSLKRQNRIDEAYDAFYKAIWSEAWKAAGYYSLAEIDCYRLEFDKALHHLNRSLVSNSLNTKALNLKTTVLRHMGNLEDAVELISVVQGIDPLDVRALAEYWLVNKDNESFGKLWTVLKNHPENTFEIATEYSNAGLWRDGEAILTRLIEDAPDTGKISPLVYYYLGSFAWQMGQRQKASDYYSIAAKMPPDYVFPFQLEAIDILRHAIKTNPDDSWAPYYLGNLLFEWQPKEAIKMWEKSRNLDASFSIVHRNLAIGYYYKENNLEKAIKSLETAVSLKDKYAIHFFELDKLYEEAGVVPEKRLAILKNNHNIVALRDDALSRQIFLEVNMGHYDRAIELMKGRQFNVWEGGARFRVNEYWSYAYLLRGHQFFASGRYSDALVSYRSALDFPENLSAAKSNSAFDNQEVAYWIGNAHEALGNHKKATLFWKESTSEEVVSKDEEILPISNKSVMYYFQAQSLIKLGEKKEADIRFEKLIRSGKQALTEGAQIDFFAKFGQQQNLRSRLATAYYLIGLGYYGLGKKDLACDEFHMALEVSPDHLGAKYMLSGISSK